MQVMRLTYFYLIVATVLFSACKEVKDPVFKGIDSLKIENMRLDLVEISTIAHFYNPNPVRIDVEGGNIEIVGNGVNLGSLDFIAPTKIPAQEDFTIAMKASFPPSKLIGKKGDLLGGILSTMLDKKVELEYTGYIDVKVLGISIQVPVEEFEELELKF